MGDCYKDHTKYCGMIDEVDKWKRIAMNTLKRVGPWYTFEEIYSNRKYLELMFRLESQEEGDKFRKAILNKSFSILNHFLLNTDSGKATFPGMTVGNLFYICED